MDRNPYAPPTSYVTDPTEYSGERPKQVTQAVRLLWIAFVLDIVRVFGQPMQARAPAERIGGVIALVVWAWLIMKISGRRNWARMVYIVLACLGVIFSVFTLPYTIPIFKVHPFSGVISGLNLLLEVPTLYLLLTTAARTWFTAPAAAT